MSYKMLVISKFFETGFALRGIDNIMLISNDTLDSFITIGLKQSCPGFGQT